MNIYFAIATESDAEAISRTAKLSDINVLTAYPYRKALLGHKPSEFRRFIADSGAFTAMNSGTTIDAQYMQDSARWVVDNGIRNYVELDLDEIIGVEKTRKLRSELERTVGYPSMPCWHCERGAVGWEEMCERYDYVCISLSGFTKTSKWLKSNSYKPLSWFLDTARKHGAKVHALGCTNVSLLKRFGFYSSDSSTFSVGHRYGTVLDFRNGVMKSRRPNPEKKKDRLLIMQHNIEQTVRMAEYAERHW